MRILPNSQKEILCANSIGRSKRDTTCKIAVNKEDTSLAVRRALRVFAEEVGLHQVSVFTLIKIKGTPEGIWEWTRPSSLNYYIYCVIYHYLSSPSMFVVVNIQTA